MHVPAVDAEVDSVKKLFLRAGRVTTLTVLSSARGPSLLESNMGVFQRRVLPANNVMVVSSDIASRIFVDGHL